MPEQVCSGIFYDHCFLSVCIVEILYKAEAKHPETELRENITLDIKDGAALKRPRPHSRHHTTRHYPARNFIPPDTTPLYITLRDIAPLGITLPEIVLRDVPLADLLFVTLF